MLIRESGAFKAGFCFLNGSLPDLLPFLAILHPEEKACFDALKFDKRKTSYLQGRAAAKYAIAAMTGTTDLKGIRIDSGIFNFPVVKHQGGENIQVSISHCDHLGAALAFPEVHPLALDLEMVKENNAETLKNYASENEKGLLAATNLPEKTAYTLIWTVKEGLSKALKTGLSMDFRLFEIKSLLENGLVYESAFLNTVQYKAQSMPSGDFVLSVILPRKTTADLSELWTAFREISG